jgi:hypothetical protein
MKGFLKSESQVPSQRVWVCSHDSGTLIYVGSDTDKEIAEKFPVSDGFSVKVLKAARTLGAFYLPVTFDYSIDLG